MIKRAYVLALDGAVLTSLFAGRFITNWMRANITSCISTRIGLLCPACGGTRCLQYLLHGDFLRAFFMNPYLFLTAMIAMALLILLNVAAFTPKHMGMPVLRWICKPRWVIVWAIGFAVFGVLRNFI